MRIRFLVSLLVIAFMAFMLASCTRSDETVDNVSDTVSEIQETVQPLEDEVEPVLTEAAATIESVVTESAMNCEDLPEIRTEGEEGVTVPENAVAVYQKTGGFAGINETTIIYEDGFIENNKGETYQAPPEAVQAIVSSADDVGFFDLKRNYVPEGHCCDFFNYSLTIRNCEQVNTVITADEVPGAPAALVQIINTIEGLVANTSA